MTARRRAVWPVAVALVGGAGAARLAHLGGDSFWIDEISVTSLARDPGFPGSLVERAGPFEPPLSFLAVRAAVALGPDASFEAWARLPSALAGTAEVALAALLAWELTRSRRITLVASALLAAAPFGLRLSQDARYYPLFSLLALAAWWTGLRAWRAPTAGRWAAWGTVVGVGMLTHPFTPLVVAGQAVVGGAVSVRRRARPPARPVAAGVAVAVLLAAPWWTYAVLRWRSGPRRRVAINEPGTFDVRVDLDLLRRSAEWLLGNAARLTPLVAALAAAIAVGVLAARGRPGTVARVTMTLCLGTALALVPLARAMGTYFAMRRVGFLVPPLLIVAAIGIDAAGRSLGRLERRRAGPLAAAGVTAITVGVLALSVRATAGVYRSERTPYRELAEVVEAAPADDLVVIGPVPGRWRSRIPDYLDWRGVRRPVRYLRTRASPAELERVVPAGTRRVTWLLPSSPARIGLPGRALADPGRQAVIAGDRSWGNVILPWYAARSVGDPDTVAAVRDAVATLPALVRLDAPERVAPAGRA